MNLNSQIKKFFEENDYHRLADNILVLRNDGIVVFSTDKNEDLSLGALVAGVWQAAQALSSSVSTNHAFSDFRLSFDSSSDGVYVVPMTLVENDYYLCSIYQGEQNPGKLKRNIRLVAANLELFLKDHKDEVRSHREGYLFSDITDAEIDRLFVMGEA